MDRLAAAAAAHRAGASAAAAAAAAGESDPAPSIATSRGSRGLCGRRCPHPVLRRSRAGALSQPVLRPLAGRSSLCPTSPSRPPPRAATPSLQKAPANPRHSRRPRGLPRRLSALPSGRGGRAQSRRRGVRGCPVGLSAAGPGEPPPPLPRLLLLAVAVPEAAAQAARARAAGLAVAAWSRTLLSWAPLRPAGPFCPRAARLSRSRDLGTPLCVCAAGSGRSSSLIQ